MLHKIIYNHVDVSLPSYVSYRSRHTWSNALKFIQIGSTIDPRPRVDNNDILLVVGFNYNIII